MANLWTGKINSTEYQKLETLSGQEFTDGNSYILQGIDGSFFIREGEAGKGFFVQQCEKVQFTKGDDDLYVAKDFCLKSDVTLNIAE